MNGNYLFTLKPQKHIRIIRILFTSASAASEGPPKRESQFSDVNTLCRENSLKDIAGTPLNSDTNTYTYASLLQRCTNIESLNKLHARILITGTHQNVFLDTKLVSMYATCGSLENARLVFDKVYNPDVSLWNAIIRGYAKVGVWEETLGLYHQMQQAGMEPNRFTFPFVLKACARLSDLQEGEEIHHQIVRNGLESDVYVGTALLDMYAKCGSIGFARQLFDKMSKRDPVSWNAMIAGYTQTRHSSEALTVFHQMQLAEVKPNLVTMLSVIPACAHLQQGKWIHAYVIRTGFEPDVSVMNALVDMYAKCRNIEAARQLFDKMPKRDLISWNTMIAGYALNGFAHEALKLFHQMQLDERKPDSVTMVSVLPSCAHLAALQQGKWIHAYIIRNGFGCEISVLNALIDMYAKCNHIEVSCQLFNKMYKRDVISWSAMIAGYAQHGFASEALSVFHQMLVADMKPNQITMLSVLQACGDLAALQEGKKIHDYIVKNGLELDVSVETALVTMYAKCSSIELAKRVFDKMSKRDVISWSAMIVGYAQNGLANEALEHFHQMRLTDMKPNLVTIVSVLPACADLAALQQGKDIHDYIIKNGFESDVSVGTALVDMYAKCGNIEVARRLFDEMSKRDVATWNTMIGGYGMHGQGEDALELFSQMQQTGMKPDHITFICVLSACSHTGLVDEGWHYFDCMSHDYCISPMVEHYACMVDLLGRAGHLDEAQDFIKNMPLEPDAGVWGALFGACRIHGNIELGEHAAECVLELEPKDAGNYVLLSNIYAAAGRWDDVAKVRIMLRNERLKKIPACSWIEIKHRTHAFHAGDRSHPQSEEIYAMLESLAGQVEDAGYVPDTSLLLHDVEDEKEYNFHLQ